MKHLHWVRDVALWARARGPLVVLCFAAASPGSGQTTIDLRTQTRNVDFSGAVSTKPVKTGAALPGSCATGELFFKTTATPGKNLYTCAANQWTAVIGAGGTGAPNFAASFSGQTSVVLQHDMSTVAVAVQCFDNAVPPAMIEASRVTATDANRVDVTFAKPQSGACVVNGSGGGGTAGGGTGGSVTAGEGLLSSGGVLQVNPAAVRSYLTGSGSFDFGSIPGSGGCASRTVSVAGAVIGDKAVIGAPAELLTYSLAMTYAVTSANTVTIRLCNYTPAAIAPPSWTWNVDVVKSF